MKIYNHEEDKKGGNPIIRENKYENYVSIFLGLVLIGMGIYFMFNESTDNKKLPLPCIVVGAITILYGIYGIIKIKKELKGKNIFNEIRDDVNNKHIESILIEKGFDIENCDYIFSMNFIEIGYSTSKYIYFNCYLTKKEYAFGIELTDEVYNNLNDKEIEELLNINSSDIIDEYEEFKFNKDDNKNIVYNGFKEFIENKNDIYEDIRKKIEIKLEQK